MNDERVVRGTGKFRSTGQNVREKMMVYWEKEGLFERVEMAPEEAVAISPALKVDKNEQKALIDLGRQLLSRVVNKQPLDLSGLFAEVSEVLSRVLPDSQGAVLLSPKSSQRAPLSPRSPRLARSPRPGQSQGTLSVSGDEGDLSIQNYLVAIVAVSWALYDVACSQKDTFQRGSITVVDYNHSVVKVFVLFFFFFFLFKKKKCLNCM
jgi:hypothetical protein